MLESGRMTYLKCALAGIVTGVMAGVLWVVLSAFAAFHSVASSGAGGLGAVSFGLAEMLIPGGVGFLLGFYLMLRRQRARSAASHLP